MTRKMILAMTVVAGMVGCGGRSDAKATQAGYETVQEGSAAGVTSTIHGPGETLPPITDTNADTTTAFALDPNAAAAAGGAQPAQAGTLAGTLPPPAWTPTTDAGNPSTAQGASATAGSRQPVTRTPASTPSYPSQPRQVYVPQPAPSPTPRPAQPSPAPAPSEPAPQQPAEGTDTATTEPPPPTSTTETAPPPKQDSPKQDSPKPEQTPPPAEEEEPEEEPPPPPPPGR